MDYNYHGGEIKDSIKYDYSVNINPLGMPDYVKGAIISGIDSYITYPDRRCVRLRELIASREEVAAGNVLCGNGASELIMAMMHAFDGKVAVMEPTFSGYERAAIATGHDICYYRSIGDVDHSADIIFICNPGNPTGEIIERDELIAVVRKAKEQGVKVIIDECFIDFTHEESMSKLVDSLDNLIVLKALTKFYGMAGVRLGYICASHSICEQVSSHLPEWNVSAIAEVAGVAAYSSGMDEWKDRTLTLIDKEREYMLLELKSMGIKVSDSKANFILCESEIPMYDRLLSQGILIRDCSNFRTLDGSYFRVCVGKHESNQILLDAIRGQLWQK